MSTNYVNSSVMVQNMSVSSMFYFRFIYLDQYDSRKLKASTSDKLFT